LEVQKKEFIKQGVPKKNIRLELASAADPIRFSLKNHGISLSK
jgi:hypothetical protein